MIQVSIPIYREIPSQLLRPLMEVVQAFPPGEVSLRTYTNDGLISRVRNRMFSDFVNGTATHLITFDCDCMFTLDDFMTLHSHKDSSKDIVVGAVPFKTEDPNFVYRLVKPMNREGPLLELNQVGDFMILSREAALQLVDKHPELEYDEEGRGKCWAVFQPIIHEREYMDETWSFCLRAKNAGLKMWLDTRIVLGHLGQKVYRRDVKQ